MSEYPRGKFNADDEGALAVAVGVKDKTVLIDFGKPVAWLGLDAQTALNLANSIRERALEIQPEKRRAKPILCLDFDGVIHRYDRPWTSETEIRDDATDGFFEWAERAAEFFTLVVYSSRSKNPAAVVAMAAWMGNQRQRWRQRGGKPTNDKMVFEFSHEKPAAFLTIDDRALTFEGDWSALDPATLRTFKPWNKKP